MTIHFACPSCKSVYAVSDKDAGKKSECKNCGQRIQVPTPKRTQTVLGEEVTSTRMGSALPEPLHWTKDPIVPQSKVEPVPAPVPEVTPEPEREPEPAPRRRRSRGGRRQSHSPVYPNEESVRFRSSMSREEIERVVSDVIGRLGYVSLYSNGEFDVKGGRFQSFATDVKMAGFLAEGSRDDEWTVSVSFTAQPSPLCWVIAILGFFFFLIGPLIFIMPLTAKTSIQQAVSRAVRDVRNEVERMDE